MRPSMPFSLAHDVPLRTVARARAILPGSAPSNREYLAGGLWAAVLLQPGLKHKHLIRRMLPQQVCQIDPAYRCCKERIYSLAGLLFADVWVSVERDRKSTMLSQLCYVVSRDNWVRVR